jgi:hypothetical protein
MSDATMPPPDPNTAATPPLPGLPPPPYGAVPAPAGPAGLATAPVGKVRDTGTCFLLRIVTRGIYGWVWYFKTHDEMKRHTGTGIGGGIALLLGIFVGIVMPFLSSNEVGHLYERRGHKAPVSALTGLWALLLGWFFFVGIIVWFVKTNGALNAYWRSLGAR